MENTRMSSKDKSKTLIDISLMERSITTIDSSQSSLQSDNTVKTSSFEKIAKKCFNDDYFYFAYRV